MLVKEITIKELATLYNVSDRIIQSKMKKLGYGITSNVITTM